MQRLTGTRHFAAGSIPVLLDHLEVAVNAIDSFGVEHATPNRHAFVRTSLHDSGFENTMHVVSVAGTQVPQVALGQARRGIRPVTVSASLIEQRMAFADHHLMPVCSGCG